MTAVRANGVGQAHLATVAALDQIVIDQRVVGAAAVNDGYHMTHSDESGEGAAAAIRMAIAERSFSASLSLLSIIGIVLPEAKLPYCALSPR